MNRCPHFTLELLRGGPPHNQLVSPITEYLALCGDAAPHTLRLPFEQGDLTHRLQLLRYDDRQLSADPGTAQKAEQMRQARARAPFA